MSERIYDSEELAKGEVADGCFKDHIATRTDYAPGITAIDWRNKDGSIGHYVRFLFDDIGGIVTISGDLGYAVVAPTWNATPEKTVKHIGNTHYFIEKIRGSSDTWDYCEELAEAEIREQLYAEGYDSVPEEDLEQDYGERDCWEDDDEDESDEPEYSEEAYDLAKALSQNGFCDFDEFVGKLLENYDSEHGVYDLDESVKSFLEDLGYTWYEFVDGLGKQPDIRVHLWAAALEMAMKQLGKDSAKDGREQNGEAAE